MQKTPAQIVNPSFLRPDNRPSGVVWPWFEKEFENCDWPSVSWALGSDWGVGSRLLAAEEYKAVAYRRMEQIYGPNPAAAKGRV